MARKPSNTVAEEIVDATNTAAVVEASGALSMEAARSMEIAERFGDGVPYERERIVSEARFFMAASAEAMLELGKRLIQIKENEPHGEFTEIVTQRLGIGYRAAVYSMQAAARLMNPKLHALAGLGKRKLLDLLVEPDDSLIELTEGGTLAGHTLDDMQSMTTRELKDALVKARQANAAKDAVIAKKDEKLNALAEKLEIRRHATGDELATEQLEILRALTSSCDAALAQLVATAAQVMEEPADEAVAMSARQALDYMAQRFTVLARNQGLTLSFDDALMPAHMREIREQIVQSRKGGKAGR